MTISNVTLDWIRNPSDQRAADNGCFFSPETAALVIWWIEKHCILYEGDYAGQHLYLWGCHECENYGLPASHTFYSWDDEETRLCGIERMRRYVECVKAGHHCDWQYDCTSRIFGWQVQSVKWKRAIRRFRQATIFTPKKCKKSATASAIGIYLTIGDGEPGAHVYFGHKDGDAAKKIMGEHAKLMILQSDEWAPPNGSCKINGTTMRISHALTNSYMEPMSSSNSRTQESKEGLNGSVILDELHVVDGELVRRISRMGISRSEPMQLEISTAGNNPDSYGRTRFSYAQEVERGERIDQSLFVAIYAAPQDVTDEALKADPIKYGKMANPAWGQTVEPEEYLDDFNKSQRSIQDWLDFKMYRLNIWQKGSNPWLRSGDWAACQEDFTEDDLAGQECWAALDLSRTKDMCSLSLTFKDHSRDEHFFQLTYFWLPAERAQELASEGVLPEWSFKCDKQKFYLQLTPGDVIDYNAIKTCVRELAGRFSIQELAFDPHFGEEITQSLCEGTLDANGKIIEANLGIPRFAFAQTDANFAAPTADFERLVLAHRLHHNGNPVMAWQAAHVQVMVKISKVKRAVKPSASSPKTIDGVVSGIMSLGRAMLAKDESWYSYGTISN